MDLQMQLLPNGGDLVAKIDNSGSVSDILMVFGFENVPLLALFGGNKEASTKERYNQNEERFDYWANSLMLTMPDAQFNSETQNVMYSVPLTSNGRIKIENAIKRDLQFMSKFAKVVVSTAIIATNVLSINIKIIKPENLEQKEYIFIWDSTRDELSTQDYIPVIIPNDLGLQYDLQFNI